ncbi:MAG TPA: enoyl-CoA hydratase/isomerase family protein [Streptosporangiaceae bacterium]|nr:enoyl-CoA hydratase/isomerase family protein [Streptosporangiaceae bacterium]
MDTIKWETRDKVGYLQLQRPERLNSLTPAVLDDLERVLDEVDADPVLRAVVVSAVGNVFCVGMDTAFLHECFADVPGVFVPFCERYHRILRRIEALPVVVVAAVDGLARAGGFELLIACDLVLATTRSRIADHHIVFGMIPGAGATPRATRKLGQARTRDLMLTGRWLQGTQIAEYGIAIEVVEPDLLDSAVEQVLERVRPLSGPCLARMKRLVNVCADIPLSEGLDLEFAEFVDYHATEPTSADGFYRWAERAR